MVRHGRDVTFQMAAAAVSGRMFGHILARITRLSAPPAGMTRAVVVVVEGKIRREVCLDDGEHGHQHQKTAVGAG